MARKLLLEKRGAESVCVPIELVSGPKDLASVANKASWKILEELAKKPLSVQELSLKLKVHEQNVYYHVNRLRKAGIITVAREEQKQGAVCRFFTPSAHAFGIELPGQSFVAAPQFSSFLEGSKVREFFHEFVSTGTFDGVLVPGSPVEHGPYLKTGRDAHHGIHLAFFLGGMCRAPQDNLVAKLDTEVKGEKLEKENFILLGGPVTNTVYADFHDRLPVKFEWKESWGIRSTFTGKYYDDYFQGLIAKVKNPWDKDKRIVVVAGVRNEGTRACILALTQHHEKLLEKFERHKDYYAVIQGLDLDGDGKADSVKVLEQHVA